ncbi:MULTISPECIES: hypothetical protein [unclassified Micromonospora]|uniref:hypothetical protein n=1 Tax=unclassified Micromonospora TaxID=2617518 RepID=UPI001C223CB2|nr:MULTISPECIES: hypothetical protein [unclassified Micromonospora]MBU8861152.1 hypothetical protein [Micromonospora sp. WMMB482]MDM4780701.1 hypothetical protein [Micromonospora sp. b486]
MRGDDGMHARRSGGPADRAESDRLLGAARAGTPPEADADPLTRLLSAAAGPAAPGEVAGEERALAAFRAARAAAGTAPAAVAAPRPRRRLRIAAALSGLAATAVAGVAFAAVRLDHHRPEPVVPPATTAGPTGTGPGVTGPSRPAPSTPAGDASGAASPPAPTPSGTPSATARPPAPPAGDGRMAGHCRAYLAKSERQREKALTKPGFADLVAAAGGPEQVESYCRNLVGESAEDSDDDSDDDDSPERPGPRTDD